MDLKPKKAKKLPHHHGKGTLHRKIVFVYSRLIKLIKRAPCKSKYEQQDPHLPWILVSCFLQLDGIRQQKRWQIIFLKVFVKKSDFKSVKIIGKKCTQKKLFAKNCSKRTISNVAHFFAYNFLVANFSHFSQQFRNQRKFCSVLIPIFKFCEEKHFRSYYCNIFLNFKAQLSRNGLKYGKTCSTKVS